MSTPEDIHLHHKCADNMRRISRFQCDASDCGNVAAHLWVREAEGSELFFCERHHYYAITGNFVRINGAHPPVEGRETAIGV